MKHHQLQVDVTALSRQANEMEFRQQDRFRVQRRYRNQRHVAEQQCRCRALPRRPRTEETAAK